MLHWCGQSMRKIWHQFGHIGHLDLNFFFSSITKQIVDNELWRVYSTARVIDSKQLAYTHTASYCYKRLCNITHSLIWIFYCCCCCTSWFQITFRRVRVKDCNNFVYADFGDYKWGDRLAHIQWHRWLDCWLLWWHMNTKQLTFRRLIWTYSSGGWRAGINGHDVTRKKELIEMYWHQLSERIVSFILFDVHSPFKAANMCVDELIFYSDLFPAYFWSGFIHATMTASSCLLGRKSHKRF